jgi:hypothetical protein
MNHRSRGRTRRRRRALSVGKPQLAPEANNTDTPRGSTMTGELARSMR